MEARVDHKGTQRNLWAEAMVLYLDCSDSHTTLHACQNSQNFTVYKLYFNINILKT